MGKLNQNFTHWKGNYREIDFFIEDVDSLSGCTIEWAMAADANSTELITKSTEDTPATITISGKTATVILESSDTDASSGISAGEYYHELRIVDGDSNPFTPAIGTVTLKDVLLDGS